MITVEIDSEIFYEASNWEIKGTEMALAIVLKTWGSSPRQPGSMMLIREDGHLVGSVSGGCVEGAVIVGSQQIIKENNSSVRNNKNCENTELVLPGLFVDQYATAWPWP